MIDNGHLKFTPGAVLQVMIAQKVISGIFPGVTTTQLDELAAETGMFDAARVCGFSGLARAYFWLRNDICCTRAAS